MATTLLRIVKYGLQNFWRNGLLSVATIIVMVLALLTFEGLMLFSEVTKGAIASLENKIDISVYFKTDTKEDDVLAVERAIKALPEVERVAYISRDEALRVFRLTHAGDPTINKALDELGENPFAASLNIKAKSPEHYRAIAAYAEREEFAHAVSKVTYSENKNVIDSLTKIITTVNRVGVTANIIFAFIAMIIAFNTIRLAIYANREEIGVMRLVGASNAYIRGPYVVEGILYGVIGTVIALLIITPIVVGITPYVNIVIRSVNLSTILYSQFASIFLNSLLLGVALGVISSSIAITRYLKV